MKSATSLALVAVGAIFAFAITGSPRFLNLQVVGWVLMFTGAAGAIIPRRGHGWLRRSVVVRDDDAVAGPPARTRSLRPADRKYNRFLMPGGIVDPRTGRQQILGQVERETIEEYIEE